MKEQTMETTTAAIVEAAEVIPTKVTDSPELRHGRKYYLANYDWSDVTGEGDFTYVDRATGEALQLQRPQPKFHTVQKGRKY